MISPCTDAASTALVPPASDAAPSTRALANLPGGGADRPQFVWLGDGVVKRNEFGFFRRHFELAGQPLSAFLHLFADTRYRLFVNGEVVHYGPARFLPAHPEFDTINLLPWLRVGGNVIVVEVNSCRDGSYESLPSRGGFIASGRIEEGAGDSLFLDTPGAWMMRRCTARDPKAPDYSFAQGPVEIVDLSRLPAGLHDASASCLSGWEAPVLLTGKEAWGKFSPRSIPLLQRAERTPFNVVAGGPLIRDEERLGFRFPSEQADLSKDSRQRIPWFTHVYSPVDQAVELGLFWGPYFLNGIALVPSKDPVRGNRENYFARLRAGWNFLYGAPEAMTVEWSVQVGFPRDRGLRMSAEPRDDCPWSLAFGPLVARSQVPGMGETGPENVSEIKLQTDAWTRWRREDPVNSPAREMAWDTPAPGAPATEAWAVREIDLKLSADGEAFVTFDLGGEYIGHILVEMTAPEGTILDVANGEVLRPDGMIDLYRYHFATNTADRFRWAGGRAVAEAFHHRGGRYVQVCVRSANGERSPVRLHRVTVRETLYPLTTTGTFACADPLFEWAWRAGCDTVRASMADAYIDPWRERGVYVGDTLVEFHATRAMSADTAMTRRCIRLWGHGQRADGQIPDVVPAQKDYALADYSLVWVIMVRDFWAHTGDRALVAEMWPHIERVFASSAYVEAASGLWVVKGAEIFGDWGIDADGRVGETGVVNAFRYRALQCAVELADALGNRAAVARYAAELPRVARAFQTLWCPARGHFAPSRLPAGELSPARGLHANVLALLYGLANPAQEKSVEAHILAGLPLSCALAPGRLELYFLYYLLDLFYQRGRIQEAETVIRECYGAMHAQGAWTLWEGLGPIGSRCHGWACSPQHYFSERVLGVRPRAPGITDTIRVSPVSNTLSWARGVVPHILGDVEVSWERRAGEIAVRVVAPHGLQVITEASPFMDCPHVFHVERR